MAHIMTPWEPAMTHLAVDTPPRGGDSLIRGAKTRREYLNIDVMDGLRMKVQDHG